MVGIDDDVQVAPGGDDGRNDQQRRPLALDPVSAEGLGDRQILQIIPARMIARPGISRAKRRRARWPPQIARRSAAICDWRGPEPRPDRARSSSRHRSPPSPPDSIAARTGGRPPRTRPDGRRSQCAKTGGALSLKRQAVFERVENLLGAAGPKIGSCRLDRTAAVELGMRAVMNSRASPSVPRARRACTKRRAIRSVRSLSCGESLLSRRSSVVFGTTPRSSAAAFALSPPAISSATCRSAWRGRPSSTAFSIAAGEGDDSGRLCRAKPAAGRLRREREGKAERFGDGFGVVVRQHGVLA